MSKVSSLVSFASWNYGAQLTTAFLQIAYAAVTSRLVDDVGFGTYVVALSVTALISLLANGGLGQTVGRMLNLDAGRISALAIYAAGLGVAGALILLATADLWAQLWAEPAAALPIRVLAVAALMSPLSGLLSGLLRRQQRFRTLAISVVVANSVGMLIGVLAVIAAPGPLTLVISPTAAIVMLTILTLGLNRAAVIARPTFRTVGQELRFSWAVTGLSVISYLNVNIGRWALSRGVGVDTLGQWNRADVLTTVPLEQAHRALQQAIYPEFRHDIGGNERVRKVWTDLLILVAWAAFPLAAVVGVVAPAVIPIVFGPGWELATSLAFPLALILAIQMVSTTLGSALEAVGRFRWILTTHLITFGIQAVGAVYAIMLADWLPVLLALAGSNIVNHTLQVTLCATRKIIDSSRLLAGYFTAAVAAAALGGCTWGIISAFGGAVDLWVGVASGIALLVGGLLSWRYRHGLPPLRILGLYRSR